MKTIWKTELRLTDEQTVCLPKGSQPMSCEMQDTKICVWFLTDSETANTELWHFYIVGTGNPLPRNPRITLLNTILDGTFVWHVFYEDKR